MVLLKAFLTPLDPRAKRLAVNGPEGKIVLGENSKETFVVGRHEDADCLIKDIEISRKHATFKYHYDVEAWKLLHHETLNGVSVNGKPVRPFCSVSLKNGDNVGVGLGYLWEFEFPVLLARTETGSQANALAEELQRMSNEREALERSIREGEESSQKLTAERSSLVEALKRERLSFALDQEAERGDFEKMAAAKDGVIAARRQKFERMLVEKTKRLSQKQKEAVAVLEWKIKEGETKVESVVKERDALTGKFQAEMERFEAAVAKERAAKAEMASELESKSNEVEKLNRELRQAQQGGGGVKKRKADFVAQCNSELKCSICDELFIEPVAVNCGHVFCQYCIDQWKRSGSHEARSCPYCRAAVTSTVRSRYLDNLIDGLYTGADEGLKRERQVVVGERKEVQKRAGQRHMANPRLAAARPSSAAPPVRAPFQGGFLTTRSTTVSAPSQALGRPTTAPSRSVGVGRSERPPAVNALSGASAGNPLQHGGGRTTRSTVPPGPARAVFTAGGAGIRFISTYRSTLRRS